MNRWESVGDGIAGPTEQQEKKGPNCSTNQLSCLGTIFSKSIYRPKKKDSFNFLEKKTQTHRAV